MDKIYVFGHQKPDTDSVTSAITLAYLKQQLGMNTEPRILGDINKETIFVLNYFKAKKPKYLDSVKLQLKDMDYYRNYYVNENISLNEAYYYLVNKKVTGMPVIDKEKKLLGIFTIKDIMKKIKDISNHIHTSYDNLIKVLDGEPIIKIDDEITGEIVLKNNQVYVLEDNIVKLIITNNKILNKAVYQSKEINVIESKMNLFEIASNIIWTNYVKDIISSDRFYAFSDNTYYDEFLKETNKLHFNNYPIIGKNNECRGLIRLTDIISKNKKKVILVDHNELQQSVDGLEEAEIIEIIDHHKIGSLSTNSPISFRNMTVGSTNTIVYQMYIENNIKIPYQIGGLMLSGILSDTLALTSSTTTDIDVNVVMALSNLLKIDYKKYYIEMLKAGTSLEGLTKEEIINQDIKYFQVDSNRYAISQTLTMDIEGIMKDKNEYLKIIDNYKKSNDLELMLFIITDAIKNGSYLLYTEEVEDMIGEIYQLEDVYQGIFVPNLTSRKKQVVPYINEYLK